MPGASHEGEWDIWSVEYAHGPVGSPQAMVMGRLPDGVCESVVERITIS